jgi:hypothetical protein
VDAPARFRVEQRPPRGEPVVLAVAARLGEAARLLEAHRLRLAEAGVRGSLVLVVRLAEREVLVVARPIGLGVGG